MGVWTLPWHGAWDGKTYWYCDFCHSILCRADLDAGKVALEAELPLSSNGQFAYGTVAFCAGRLVLAPMSTDTVLLYDTVAHTFDIMLAVDDLLQMQQNWTMFSGIIVRDDYAYLLPGRYNRILKLCLRTKTVQTVTGDYLATRPFSKLRRYGAAGQAVVGDRAFLAHWEEGQIVEIDLPRDEAHLVRVADVDYCYSDISTTDGESFWLCVAGAPIIIHWNRRTGTYREYSVESVVGSCGIQMVDDGDALWLVPGSGASTGAAIGRLEKVTGKMEKIISVPQMKPEIRQQIRKQEAWLFQTNFVSTNRIDERRIILSCIPDGCIWVLDIRDGSVRTFPSALENPEEMRRAQLTARLQDWQRALPRPPSERGPLDRLCNGAIHAGVSLYHFLKDC